MHLYQQASAFLLDLEVVAAHHAFATVQNTVNWRIPEERKFRKCPGGRRCVKVGGLAEAEAGRAWHPLSRPTLQEAAAATAGGGGTATAPLVPYLFADTSLVIAQSSFLIMRTLAAEILHPLTPSPIPNPSAL